MKTISRREFVRKSTGALIVGFSLHGGIRPVVAWMEGPAGSAPAAKSVVPEELDSWIAIGKDGRVTVYTGRIDMGTGVETAFAQLVSDELDVPFHSVKMIMGDTGLTPDQGKSTGSTNASSGAQPLRTAAAEARQVLLKLASNRLGVPVEQLEVRDGVIRVHGAPSTQVSYGELIGGGRFNVQLKATDDSDFRGADLQGTARLKDHAQLRIVGQSVPRVDVPAKVTGSFTFVHDIRLPRMLHGRVVRPSAVGATLVGVDENSVSGVPGLVKVVRKGNFVGVVTEREEQAIQAARQLKVTWTQGRGLPEYKDLYRAVRSSKLVKTQVGMNEGDVDAALSDAAKVLKATYEFPVQLHAMIGPSCAVADVRDGQATIWSGSQWPQGNRRDLARLLGLPVENVRLIWVEASGSYGRLGCDDATADAALLSQEVGRPVRVQWMRQEENRWEPMSPAMVIDVRAGLDAQGRVLAFDFEQWSPSHSTGEAGNFVAWRLLGTAPGWERLSGGPHRHSYEFENNRMVAHYVEELFRAIYLRAPGRIQDNLAIESFLDEIAAELKADPVEFRLRYLKDRTAVQVLDAAVKKAGWEARPSPRHVGAQPRIVTGRGVAFGEHSRGQRVAMVAEVEVNRDSGKVRVLKLVIASLCGRIINPQGLKHQVQGAVLQGVSRTLLEEVKFDRSHVRSLDWNSYPILTFPDVPEIETVLLDQPDVEPSGVGELATVPVAAALSNAIFDATGVRLRQVPFTPARVQAALA